jgi:hypothetical protein
MAESAPQDVTEQSGPGPGPATVRDGASSDATHGQLMSMFYDGQFDAPEAHSNSKQVLRATV